MERKGLAYSQEIKWNLFCISSALNVKLFRVSLKLLLDSFCSVLYNAKDVSLGCDIRRKNL